ncbi:MAG: DUF2330 domain-containing protein [Candidatus Dormibacteraeota bacterium]|nr:DUF2330 domain-containing protein [Candidatus Dormibacteraeota bacterium]
MFRTIGAVAMAAVALVFQVVPAAACGGLISPNGSIRLTRASTVVDWHDGVEHYLTSFSYQGAGFSDFGFIVPLPAAPDRVEEGGGWTLQRLTREVQPQTRNFTASALQAGLAPPSAQVLQTVQVKALDITVLKGSGQSVVEWCLQNHYFLNAETRAHLLVYGTGSPFFMAAKYDVARAQSTNQLAGDGSPVLITMHTPHLWVPLEILANGVRQVSADVFLLTANQVFSSDLAALDGESPVGGLVPHAAGVTIPYQQRISDQLFRDLATDKNMGWVRPDSWLTYVQLNAPASTVEYDMGLSGSGVIHLAAYGTAPARVPDGRHDLGVTVPSDPGQQSLPPGIATLILQVVGATALLVTVVLVSRDRRRAS